MGGSDRHGVKESSGEGGEGRRGARGRGRRSVEKGRSGRKKRMNHPREEDAKEETRGKGSVSSSGGEKERGREEEMEGMQREGRRRDRRMFPEGDARGEERKERAYEKAWGDEGEKEDKRRRGGLARGDRVSVNDEDEKRRREGKVEGEAREEEKREEKSGEEEGTSPQGEGGERIRKAEGKDRREGESEERKEGKGGASSQGERIESMRKAAERGGEEGRSIVAFEEESSMMSGDWERGREEERESGGRWESGEGGFTRGTSGERGIIPTSGVEVSRSTPPASLEEEVTEAGRGVSQESPASRVEEEEVRILPRPAGTMQVDVFDRLERIARTYRQEELPFDLHEQPPLPQNVYRAHLDELYAQLRRAYQLAQQDVYAINVYRLAEETERLARLRELGWRDEKRFWQSLSLLERLLERAPLLREVLPQHVPHWERIEEELEYYNAYRQRKR